ncbi:putative inhibitor of apoptosis [Xiphias gladius]|uniref:putative inhibitor of apoptosis n=1 Tax=Xiphias gladius TaxID=8245 RepID=UPI001A98F15E|nr:putative inhibitor of apoptosis [Xiphias gladius]
MSPRVDDCNTELFSISTFACFPASGVTERGLAWVTACSVSGRNDDVKCFCCDGGLRCWESGDDPWVEHAKWFPRCEYLLQEKGQEFVHQIQARFPRLFEQ